MPRTWTPEQKAAQAAKIRSWKPWEASTGPRTPAGKAASARNAITHGRATAARRADAALLRAALRAQADFLKLSLEWLRMHENRQGHDPAPYYPDRHYEEPSHGDTDGFPRASEDLGPGTEKVPASAGAAPKKAANKLFTPPDTSDA